MKWPIREGMKPAVRHPADVTMPSAPGRIIDAHHHLWDLDRIYYPWLTARIVPDFLFGDYASIRRNYLPNDLRHDARNWNLRMSVHVEAERADEEQLAETQWLSEMHERYGLPNAIDRKSVV